MKRIIVAISGLAFIACAAVAWMYFNDPDSFAIASKAHDAGEDSATLQIEKGRYLALAGNCAGCHTLPGSEPYAGGYGVPTPYGTIYAPNLTPDKTHGLGSWTSADFWRAMHHGRSKNGRFLYPAFPYTNYTKVTRADSDLIFVYLQSLPIATQANKTHTLRFPYNTQAALAVWRMLYFKAGEAEPVAAQSMEWNRGAYLVSGLGHCDACHAERGFMGAVASGNAGRGSLNLSEALQGGVIPQLNWYAPPLNSKVAKTETAKYLTSGLNSVAYAGGPMAEVVYNSTQYLSDSDAAAISVFISSLPLAVNKASSNRPPAPSQMGAAIYEKHCESCHGKSGEGAAGAYPRLAASASVLTSPTNNLIRVLLEGGFGASTAANPRPFGMPPFAQVLSSTEIAAVLTHIRSSWGNAAGFVNELDVINAR